MSVRVDRALYTRGMTSSRSRAQYLVLSGVVLINGNPIRKMSQMVTSDDQLTIVYDSLPWVSRGALKLDHAINFFNLNPLKGVALDVGASTGGFSQVLLQYGISCVHAIDVGKGQLHPILKADKRVISYEGLNSKNFTSKDFPNFDYIVCDVSFISIKKALEQPLLYGKKKCKLLALIKPQFEIGLKKGHKKGIVKKSNLRQEACDSVMHFLNSKGWSTLGLKEIPMFNSEGNVEFMVLAEKL